MAELNLIPYELKKRKQDKIVFKDLIAYIVLFVCITFSAIYFPLMKLSSLRTSEASLKAEVEKNAPIAAETQRLNKEISNVKSTTAIVDQLVAQRVIVNTVISGFEAYTPSDVVLTNLSYGKSVINITAKSPNYNSLCIFAANLQLSKEYTPAKLIGINSNQTTGTSNPSGYTCTITIGKQGVK